MGAMARWYMHESDRYSAHYVASGDRQAQAGPTDPAEDG